MLRTNITIEMVTQEVVIIRQYLRNGSIFHLKQRENDSVHIDRFFIVIVIVVSIVTIDAIIEIKGIGCTF